MFDDEIETLSFFDPLTGEALRRVARLTVFPKTHYVTPREKLLGACEHIKVELKSRLEYLRQHEKLVESQRLEQRTLFDLEMIRELGYCSGIENYSRYLSGRAEGEAPPCLFDYLPADALLVVDESHVTVPQLGAMYKGDRSRKETLVQFGFRLPSALDNRPLRFDEFESLAPQMIYVSATPGDYEQKHADNTVEQLVRPTGLIDPKIEVRPAKTQVDDVLSEINKRAEYLCNCGWAVLSIKAYVRLRLPDLTQKIVALVESRSGAVPLRGEYGVVWGNGQRATGSSFDIDGVPRILGA